MRRLLFFLLTVCIVFVSCSGAGGDDVASFPDITLENTYYVASEADQEPIYMTAEKMEMFLDKSLVVMTNAKFTQNKKDSENVNIDGEAGYISLNTKNDNVELSGGVKIFMYDDDGKQNEISADTLKWGKYTKVIETTGNVILKYADSVMEGAGFKGNLNTGAFTFTNVTRGEL